MAVEIPFGLQKKIFKLALSLQKDCNEQKDRTQRISRGTALQKKYSIFNYMTI